MPFRRESCVACMLSLKLADGCPISSHHITRTTGQVHMKNLYDPRKTTHSYWILACIAVVNEEPAYGASIRSAHVFRLHWIQRAFLYTEIGKRRQTHNKKSSPNLDILLLPLAIPVPILTHSCSDFIKLRLVFSTAFNWGRMRHDQPLFRASSDIYAQHIFNVTHSGLNAAETHLKANIYTRTIDVIKQYLHGGVKDNHL